MVNLTKVCYELDILWLQYGKHVKLFVNPGPSDYCVPGKLSVGSLV